MDSKNNNKFYLLLSKQKFGEVILKSNFEGDFYDISEGNYDFEKEHNAEIVSGNKFFDFILFDDGVNFAISERFYELLIDNNIVGWKSYRIKINDCLKAYYGIQIIGRSGSLVYPEKRGFHMGYEFDIQTWDKTDVFSPYGTNLRFISNKLKLLLDKENFTNVLLENTDEAEFYSPGC